MIARQIVHFFLASLLLISMTGISVKQHYCCGKYEYSSLSLFEQNCMDGTMSSNNPCCQTDSQFLQVQDDFQVVSHSVELEIKWMQTAVEVPVILSLLEQEKRPVPKSYLYRPPLIPPDIPVLIQSFLI